jgi:drug/metabolite transporter (DMT)-like permease
MTLDIRIPIGLLFAILGALLVVYGLASNPAIYRRSLDININLWWGLAMLLFGALMIVLGRRGSRTPDQKPADPGPARP